MINNRKNTKMMTSLSDNSNQVEQKLTYWANQLRDMGRRNRLLFFKDTKISSFVVTEPESPEIFNRLVVQGKPIFAPLPTEEEKGLFVDLDTNSENEEKEEYKRKEDEFLSTKSLDRLNRVLTNVRYKARTIREEQGFNALYMTFGMLKWREGISGEFYEAPLILVPVDIIREKLGARFQIALFEDEIVTNPTLQTKLAKDFAIELDDVANDMTANDLQRYLENVSRLTQNLKGWSIQPKVALGIFKFQTLMIIKDLERNKDHFVGHPLIRMLGGHSDNLLDTPDVPSANELDEKVNPFDVFQILDADSSQQEAIEAAKRGASFVLQGPPGTGKSQTIANIIAESLAAGKKILFVSQKSVALGVVHNRLSSRGLGEFCLEVHSYKKNKKDVIQDLGKSLSMRQRDEAPDATQMKRELLQARSELNSYVKELHKPRLGIKLSLYQILGELSQVYDILNLKFAVDSVDELGREQHQKQFLIIRELMKYDELIENYATHPWKGFSKQKVSIQDREKIVEEFEQVSKSILALGSSIQEVATQIGLVIPETFQQVFDLLRVIAIYHPSIFSVEYAEIIDRMITDYETWSRFLKPKYWQDSSALSNIHWQGEKLPMDKVVPVAKRLKQISGEAIDAGLTIRGTTSVAKKDINEWLKLHKAIVKGYKFAQDLFKPEDLPDVLQLKSKAGFTDAANWFNARSTETDQIIEWVNFCNVVKQAEENGLGDFVKQALENNIPATQWGDVFKRRLFVLLSDAIIQSSDVLARFRSSAHDSLIERFKILDNKLVDTASLEIRSRLLESQPEATWIQADSAETTILRKELNKKRRIKPLRRLFAEIPNLILNLRPCLMMSPLTVSQLLDPEIFQFDIAIFDEASQIPPEYAVGTIMRANQVVIAGDRHQLPPTSFFHTIDSDDFDEEDYDIEEYESILDACNVINMPNKMLRWHYRSEDESLIAFSNYNFYDNQLLTFPNANRDDNSTGLEFVYVPDGIYRRGQGARSNQIEARKVAELVLSHLENSPELSLGIVTFSQSQQHVIELEIDRVRRENRHLDPLFDYNKDEQIFIKNLETVQGDERDVIIFSVGYGKDEVGKLSMNFGPLNRQGGERRLNVAVTRARRAVKLVASIEPGDIDLSRTQSHGVRLLKSYMKVARGGVKYIYEDETSNPEAGFDSPFEESVYNALAQRGVKLQSQVGVSQYRIDLGVKDPDKPGKYLLGIECDGATYHSSPTARDRDRLRQQLLEDKFGWRIHRIWSRDWIDNPVREIEKVMTAINQSKMLDQKRVVKKKD